MQQQQFTIQVTNPSITGPSFYGSFPDLADAIQAVVRIRKAAKLDPGTKTAAVPVPEGVTPKWLHNRYYHD